MVSRLSFRAKLLLVLFVPFLALVVVSAAGLSDRFTALRAQEQYGELSSPLHSLTEASRAVQNESVVSSWYVAGRGAPTAQLAAARSRTDAAVKQFRADAQAFPGAGVSPAALSALTVADKSLDAIPTERVRVDSLATDAAGAREFFLGVDDSLLGFGERAARDLGDPDASASLTRVFALERSQHELARQAGVYVAVLASGSATNFSEWVSAGASAARYQDEFTNTATPAELQAYRSVFGAGAGAAAATLPAAFPQTTQSPAAYYQQYQQQAAELDRAIGSVQNVVHDAANASSAAALRDTRVYGGAAVFAMLLTLLLIWFVSRAVVGPVRRLTAAAREMSQHQLPALVESLRTGGDVSAIQPTRIEVTSEDEIGELAQAFNDVEAVTVEVAQEQARLLRKGMGDLFVNLARRNQSLLERQLELLDDLERNEHDPAALAALFKLDHMATRMRRNAESLLVLSGAEQPRQWQDPIALLDVVRAAAAEIADFPRVELVGIDEQLAVSGRAVADVAHLIAELLENATSFSPPDSAVVVSGAVTSSGFVLAVSDQGIGMEADRIAEANHLLADPPLVGLALSRALGLHVVGALAARHDITVELRPAALVGLVALVTLPESVLERRVVPSPQPPVYAPEVSADGTPEPLGARRVAWRPPDEPPVEEWRREGLGDPQPARPAPAAPATGRDAGSFGAPRPLGCAHHVVGTRIPLRGRAGTARRDRLDERQWHRQRHGHGCAGADQRQRERRRRGRRRLHAPGRRAADHAAAAPPAPRPAGDRAARRRRRDPAGHPGSRPAHEPPAQRRSRGRRPRGRPAAALPSARTADPSRPGQTARAFAAGRRRARRARRTRRHPDGWIDESVARERSRPGGRKMMQLSAEAHNLNWLVSNFVDRVPGVQEATVVSSDGLLIALSDGLDRSSGDRLAAVSAGLLSIAKGGSAPIGGGRVHEVIVEMDNAMLFVMRVSDTSVLSVTTARPCDVGLVGYEMAVLVEKCAGALTPGLISELQTALPRSAIR